MPETVLATPVIAYLAAAAALVGLMFYAVLAGADFGGGVWDLFARGPRKKEQQEAIARAMGPVWEANHVWLIFVLVVLFTCFPKGYSVLMVGLFLPLHLILFGIMLRGAAFVFRHYGPGGGNGNESLVSHHNIWGLVFGISSIISPLLLGWSFGMVTSGDVRVVEGAVVVKGSWFAPYPMGCALLALSTCAYQAAVYLMVETKGELRADFRKRAILAGTVTAALAVGVLIAAAFDATWLFEQLRTPRALPVLMFGAAAFTLSAVCVFANKARYASFCAMAQTVAMLLGWALAHRDYLLYPDVPLTAAMAPREMLVFMLIASTAGMMLLIPSLALLFYVFKRREVVQAAMK